MPTGLILSRLPYIIQLITYPCLSSSNHGILLSFFLYFFLPELTDTQTFFLSFFLFVLHQTLSFENSTRVINDSLESRNGSYMRVISFGGVGIQDLPTSAPCRVLVTSQLCHSTCQKQDLLHVFRLSISIDHHSWGALVSGLLTRVNAWVDWVLRVNQRGSCPCDSPMCQCLNLRSWKAFLTTPISHVCSSAVSIHTRSAPTA